MPESRTVPLLQLIVDPILRLSFAWEVTMIASPLAGNVFGSVNDAFVVAEWRDTGGPPGPPRYIAPLHLHHADDEAWYVLEGTQRVLVGKDEVEANAGSGVFVPRGTVHTYWNPGPEPVRYLLIMTSNIYRLIQEIHAMQSRARRFERCSGNSIRNWWNRSVSN
jgi:mannose-6-phosphate isomerase-like protein (cupin superfamily)